MDHSDIGRLEAEGRESFRHIYSKYSIIQHNLIGGGGQGGEPGPGGAGLGGRGRGQGEQRNDQDGASSQLEGFF